MVLGRASATESFPLFGYNLADYEELFEEKLELFMKLQREQPVTWSGSTRAPLVEQTLHPQMQAGGIPTWIGVGGSPNSVIRAARYGLPLMLAIIGGQPERFVPFVEIHREAAQHAGHAIQPVSINSHAYVGDPDDFYPHYAEMMNAIGRERGWLPLQRPTFDAALTLRGALVAGSVDQVVEKIVFQHGLFGHDRFMAQTSLGSMPHDLVLKSIELLGTEVAPRIREALG
jgi:alkanesulfonate monooxygenase SsuD/methylene tetrahydromethanopterin reductase-like flavin-dependent oxidoreductase (luciferase family)